LLDALRAGVVGSQRLDQIEVVALQQFAQIACAALDIRLGIKGVLNPELRGGFRHELHQALRAFGRNGANVEATLGAYHTVHQVGVEAVGSTGSADDLVQIDGLIRCMVWDLDFCLWLSGKILRGFEVVDLGGGDIHKT
jgi:hypothetical protein